MAADGDEKPLTTAIVELNEVNTVKIQCDPRDPDFAKWYEQPPKKDSQGISMHPVRKGNEVQFFIDGPDTFKAMIAAIRTATGGPGSGHFIYMTNWWFDESFLLDRRSNMAGLLQNASRNQVEIRALLWDQPGSQNTTAVAFIDGLANGGAVLDDRTLNFGTHHQKILVVNGANGLIGFVGGVDFNPDRIDHVSDGAPLHDVHCRIRGPAVWDLLHTFVERWRDHPDAIKKRSPKFDLLGGGIPEPTKDGTEGETYVQICRTFGNGKRNAGIESNKGYSFLNSGNSGEQTIRAALTKAITTAEEFIYAEDQYMISMEISNLLKAQLPKIKKLVLLITHSSISDLPQVWKRRKAFVDNLMSSPHAAKVAICSLVPKGFKRDPRRVDGGQFHLYVHAKVWIFDDKFCTIGSPNLNRRGWTHDSEIMAAIYDESKDSPCTLHFAHQLRMKLWAEHLNMRPLDVIDPIAASVIWEGPGTSTNLMKYDQNADTDAINKNNSTPENLVDPDGS